ncbi:DnaJ-domain-containing protein [Exidia glandulosa HHB12029]|uniref:DnaJ-domain-containing protein n=1 Tax=Exidia glandulosa HHB12029 TaxID=1314781 RepID=A0A165Q083_EXIGL|nr:DnaJ-domain-containing protein [Exidia glandulosa HHB12029]
MGKDYYKILGVDKGADDDAIKRAYKKKALQYHPDRNSGSEQASEKFKEVSEAFEVLSDKQKRTVYDQFGEEGLKGGPSPGAGPSGFGGGFPGGGASFGGFPGGTTFSFSSGGPGGSFQPSNANDIFEQFLKMGGLGGMGGMGGMGGGSPFGGARRRNTFMDEDDEMADIAGEVIRPLKLSLEELYTGTTKHIKVGRRLRTGETEDKVLDVPIHAGYKSGTKIRFPRAGNETPEGDAQDLVFVVEEKPHDVFTREGNDLVARVHIPLLDALTGAGGATRTLTALSGKKIAVKVPSAVVKPGQTTTLSGQGMPIRKGGQTGTFGDLLIKWEIDFPDRLSASQQEGLKKVLG